MSKKNWFEEVKEECGSLENFLKIRENSGAEPLFFGYEPFEYFLKKELLKEGDILRTNLQNGGRDAHYRINCEGKLEGVEAARGLYSGDEGIHGYKKILGLNNADNGWGIDFFAKCRIFASLK